MKTKQKSQLSQSHVFDGLLALGALVVTAIFPALKLF